jgi:hypothetical protein
MPAANDPQYLPDTPRLSVARTRIVDPQGTPVRLRGVNRSGLEYSPRAIPDEDFAQIAHVWGANVVRLPFNQDWALNGGRGLTADDYLGLLDHAIEHLACHGAYALLDLHWLDARRAFGARRQFVPPLPDPDSPAVWAKLAKRYAANPAVMFDLLNEPHDRTAEDPYPLWRPDGTQYPQEHRRVSIEEWQPWAELLIDTVRADAPETLLFVSGTNWGYDLRGLPVNRPNLVYSTHVYRSKGDDWWGAFGHLAETAPVFVGEFGGGDDDVEWGRYLLDYLEDMEIGWAAWSYSDHPHLVTADARTTPFGEIVRQRLADPTMESWTRS